MRTSTRLNPTLLAMPVAMALALSAFAQAPKPAPTAEPEVAAKGAVDDPYGDANRAKGGAAAPAAESGRGAQAPWIGLAVVSLLTALLMPEVYKLTSNQAATRRAKDLIKAHLLEMRLYKDDMRVTLIGPPCDIHSEVVVNLLFYKET